MYTSRPTNQTQPGRYTSRGFIASRPTTTRHPSVFALIISFIFG